MTVERMALLLWLADRSGVTPGEARAQWGTLIEAERQDYLARALRELTGRAA